MQFQPKSIDEINKEKAAFGVWPVGEYNFEILDKVSRRNGDDFTREARSKSGNDMLVVQLCVVNSDGFTKTITDWVVSNQTKLYDLCKSVGLSDAYFNGSIHASDLIGRKGQLKLGIERDEQYGDRNKVSGYADPDTFNDQFGDTEPPQGHPANMDEEIPY